jgi:hypothetical protein
MVLDARRRLVERTEREREEAERERERAVGGEGMRE